MARLKDVALRAGVDISTVSKVLQGGNIRVTAETRERIQSAARDLAYSPNMLARSLRTRRSGAIAMVLANTSNYLYPEIIDGAEEAAEAENYCLFLVKSSGRDHGESLINLVVEGRIDGLLLAEDLPGNAYLADLEAKAVPYIHLNPQRSGAGPYVALDDGAGFRKQAQYLSDLGHRSIAFVAVQPESYIAGFCRNAFVEALAERWVTLSDSATARCDFQGEAITATVERLLAMRPRPTAIATASVVVAVRLVHALRGQGIDVPGEVSVIGYHDTAAAQWPEPGVTTVKMPSREQGRRGVKRLLQVIRGEPFEGEVVDLPPVVVERGSCARPSAS